MSITTTILLNICNCIPTHSITLCDNMRKIDKENIFEKRQHLTILKMLNKYHEGLTLHELTYLLTTRENMQNMKKLHERFNPYFPHEKKTNRQDVFKTRQRINDCIKDMKHLKFIVKDQKKYIMNFTEVFTCGLSIKWRKEYKKIVEEQIQEARRDIEEEEKILRKATKEEIKKIANDRREVMEKEFFPLFLES